MVHPAIFLGPRQQPYISVDVGFTSVDHSGRVGPKASQSLRKNNRPPELADQLSQRLESAARGIDLQRLKARPSPFVLCPPPSQKGKGGWVFWAGPRARMEPRKPALTKVLPKCSSPPPRRGPGPGSSSNKQRKAKKEASEKRRRALCSCGALSPEPSFFIRVSPSLTHRQDGRARRAT